MKNEEEIKKEIQSWISENIEELPLNADSWEISVHKNTLQPQGKSYEIELGRYDAKIKYSDPFYKQYSKIINIDG